MYKLNCTPYRVGAFIQDMQIIDQFQVKVLFASILYTVYCIHVLQFDVYSLLVVYSLHMCVHVCLCMQIE